MHPLELEKKYLQANKAKFYRRVKISARVIANFACAHDKINCIFSLRKKKLFFFFISIQVSSF